MPKDLLLLFLSAYALPGAWVRRRLWGKTWDPTSLASSWVMPMLLVQGPHFKQQVYKEAKAKDDFNQAKRVSQTVGQHQQGLGEGNILIKFREQQGVRVAGAKALGEM